MAPGVKETGMMQLLAPPPPKTAQADAPANGDFKAELQRRQSPGRPQEAQSVKASDRPDQPAKIAGKRSTASKKREQSDTDIDVSPQAADSSTKSKPAEPADPSNATDQEPATETTPAEPQKKKDPPDAATDPESLIPAAAPQPPVPPVQKAPTQPPASQAGSPNVNKQGEQPIVRPLTAAPKEAGQKDQAAAQAQAQTQAQAAVVKPDPSSAALAAAAGSSPPPTAATGSAAQPPQAAGPKKVAGPAPAVTPDEALAIQPESGVKSNNAAGAKTDGQAASGGDQGSAQGDAAEIHLAAQSLDEEAASHKTKSDDGSDAAFSHLLDAPGPKATSTPPPAAPPAPAPRPEAQFADANHPTIISSIRGQLLPGGGSMHIRLDPPELGAMQVTVQMHNGVMTASFETSSDEATRVLSHSLNQLKTALESQGVQVDKLQVRQQTTQESRHQGEGSQQQQQQAQDNPARQQQQRRDLMRRMWAKLALGDEPLDITG
jgi:flagellar hook-length control protein FliK